MCIYEQYTLRTAVVHAYTCNLQQVRTYNHMYIHANCKHIHAHVHVQAHNKTLQNKAYIYSTKSIQSTRVHVYTVMYMNKLYISALYMYTITCTCTGIVIEFMYMYE